MKYLLVLLFLSFNAEAWKDTGQYDSYSTKKEYREVKARQRAGAHPKGSGIGTNKYNIRYDRDYKVDKYKRK